MATWHGLSVAELAVETDGHIRSQTSEPVPMVEIKGYMLAPHAIADRILAAVD